MNIEAKLGLDVFKISAEPHITINQEICQTECQVRYCLHICPANLYTMKKVEVKGEVEVKVEVEVEGEVQVDYEGCLECGTCLIACSHDALTWRYPGAGYGIQYRFG